MRDPVTDFAYPREWVENCEDPAKLAEVERGLAVLCSNGAVLRRGYTTGTTAAAACKAAVLSLRSPVERVTVGLPSGVVVEVEANAKDGRASCRKFPGDYPGDMTAGVGIVATAKVGEGTRILAGRGIGRFVRDTPNHPVGAPAISPSAKDSIFKAVGEALAEVGLRGVTVELEVVGGEDIGPRTLNPKVGVEGGISLLGSTGLVEPWDDHLEESNLERIARSPRVVLTTGRVGLAHSRRLFPEHEAVLVGARMEKALDAATGDVVLCGLPALILKFLDPDVLAGSRCRTIEELRSSAEWGPRLERALRRGKERYPRLRVVVVDRDGTVAGDSR